MHLLVQVIILIISKIGGALLGENIKIICLDDLRLDNVVVTLADLYRLLNIAPIVGVLPGRQNVAKIVTNEMLNRWLILTDRTAIDFSICSPAAKLGRFTRTRYVDRSGRI